jgi:hypothetical protein
MSEVDVYINLLTDLGFVFQDEKSSRGNNSNILEFSGYYNDRPYSAKIWFKYSTEEVTSIKVEDMYDNFTNPTFTKQTLQELYKDKIREIKLNSILDV